MDVLGAEAEQQIQDLPFNAASNQYETIHIKASRTDYDNAVFEDSTLDVANLRKFIDLSSPPDVISTKIVRMHYHPDTGFKAQRSLFLHLWHSFHLDSYIMYLFHNNVPGFFRLPSTSPNSPLLHFYVNCQAYWFLWTYDTSDLSTNALLLSRDSIGGRSSYGSMHSRLNRYCALAGHPLFLAMVSALDRINYLDQFLKDQHRHVGKVERRTGFSHFYIDTPPPKVSAEEELAQLAELSRLSSSVLVGLADMTQHLQYSTNLINEVLTFSWTDGSQPAGVMARKDGEIKTIATLLRPQLKERFGHVSYIKERAQNQLTVVCLRNMIEKVTNSEKQIFNLLARGDAQANIDLAKAAMHDSTSMKTIAVMTMGFLPATFFAALFALPSLHWEESTVIGSRFWIYWAITIPTTILVFLIWLGIMNRENLLERIRMRSKTAIEATEEKMTVGKRWQSFP